MTALLPTPASSVSLGLSIDTANKEPCAVVPPATSLIVNGTLTNVTCSAYFSYLRNQRIRTSTPTERVSLRSNYFQQSNLSVLSLIVPQTSSTPLNESFDGLITRTNTRRLHRHRNCRCKPHFRRRSISGPRSPHPASAPDREILFLGLPHSAEWKFQRSRL